jgi:hypothetical protein
MRAPMAAASSMASSRSPQQRVGQHRSMVAPVIAETGFIVRLPHSLYQMS